MNYQERLKQHLARYKSEVLDIAEHGTWVMNGREYPHILPSTRWAENLLAPYRDDLQRHIASHGLRLHRDFHHLNSSQAMCLNLFYPLLAEPAGRDVLAAVLGVHAASNDPPRAWFEEVPDPLEETNFDLVVPTRDGGTAYFEVKLSEAGFGTAEADARHLDKLTQIYAPRLRTMVDPALLEPATFFPRYQLCRSLSYLAQPTDRLFIVYPRANRAFTRELDAFLALVAAGPRQQVVPVVLEDLVTRLLAALAGGPPRLTQHYAAFQAKYLPA